MKKLDEQYIQLGTLGHGAFSSVLLARPRTCFGNPRDVAIKMFRCSGKTCEALVNQGRPIDDHDADGAYSSFAREINALKQLECGPNHNKACPSSILSLIDWSVGHNFCAILTQYLQHGTLRDELDWKRRSPTTSLYAERRIHWYAHQLMEALSYAHQRGVAHGDIKCANIFMDAIDGKLVLGDWGSAVSLDQPYTGDVSFTKIYAAPELHTASEQDDFTRLEPRKVDAFALGCVLFETVCCTPLAEFGGDETLGQFIRSKGAAIHALQLPHVRLPWLKGGDDSTGGVGYTNQLLGLLQMLLDPNPATRCSPSNAKRMVNVNADRYAATVCPEAGSAVCMDNLYLGMLVQPQELALGRREQIGYVISTRSFDDHSHTLCFFAVPLVLWCDSTPTRTTRTSLFPRRS